MMIPELPETEARKPVVICEVGVEGVRGAQAATRAGTHRLELCAGLVEGGTTPSRGTVETVMVNRAASLG